MLIWKRQKAGEAAAVWDRRREQRTQLFVWLCLAVMAFGFLLRLHDVHLTAYNISKHDLGYTVGLASERTGAGHLGYIEYICKHRALPDFNPTTLWSFYNPPFFHILASLCLRWWTMLGIPEAQSWELVQYLPCLCIMAAVVGVYLILRELKIGGLPLLCGVALVSFHPTLTYLSLALNNDALSLAFTVWAAYFALCWFRRPRLRTIMGVALCVGLGMMTKMTVALIAPPIALLFLYRFFKDKQWIPYLKQFALFAIVCCPLGLFWSVRNIWLYHIPLTYVQALPAGSAQDVTGFTLWERFGLPPLSDFVRVESSWSPSSSLGFADHNLWSQTLRTALFDDNALILEGSYATVGAVLMVLAILLTLLYTVLTVWGLIGDRTTSWPVRLFVALSILLLTVNFVKFCYDYPMTCTIHFRYITPCLLWGSVGLGLWWRSVHEAAHNTSGKHMPAKVLLGTVAGLTLIFCLLSAQLYLHCLPLS